MNKLHEIVAEFSRGLPELHANLAKEVPYIEKRLSEMDHQMVEFVHLTPSANPLGRKIAFSMIILAQQGWYFSFSGTPIAGVTTSAAMFERGERESADTALAKHIESLVPALRRQVATVVPKRREILDDALEAHCAKKYTLSIPVFLAQADGIGAELLGVDSIYSRSKDRIAQMKKAIRAKTEDCMENEYFYLIASLMPINASFKRRDFYRNGLNRNAVLHGENVDYASYINSCKALSWLQYIVCMREHCDMLEDIKREDHSCQAG